MDMIIGLIYEFEDVAEGGELCFNGIFMVEEVVEGERREVLGQDEGGGRGVQFRRVVSHCN